MSVWKAGSHRPQIYCSPDFELHSLRSVRNNFWSFISYPVYNIPEWAKTIHLGLFLLSWNIGIGYESMSQSVLCKQMNMSEECQHSAYPQFTYSSESNTTNATRVIRQNKA